jgi:large subunit ribosomal protein L6
MATIRMSRVGKVPITLPDGVTVEVGEAAIRVKGRLGEHSLAQQADVDVALTDKVVELRPRTNTARARTMQGTMRALLSNIVVGVSQGFTRQLEITGVGYRAAIEGRSLKLQLGFSHDVLYPIPPGITIRCDRPTLITVSGTDKQRVGQVAAELRAYKKPEPYKGKGVRYANEKIRRKEGKKK